MWTTSSFRNRWVTTITVHFPAALVGIVLALEGSCICLFAQAPNAPLPRRRGVDDTERPRSLASESWSKPVVLDKLQVREFDQQSEPRLERRAPMEVVRGMDQPLLIEVKLAEAIDATVTASWPVVLLNGKTLERTYVARDEEGQVIADRLVAIIPSRKLLEEKNEVKAVWVGREPLTLTEKPLNFAKDDVAEKGATLGEDEDEPDSDKKEN